MSTPSIERDERTIAVENASYRCGKVMIRLKFPPSMRKISL